MSNRPRLWLAERTDRFAVRMAEGLPLPLLANPERIFLNAAAVLIGALALIPPPGSIIGLWPKGFAFCWSMVMIVAGLSAVHGAWTDYRRTERFGALLFAFGSFTFGASAFVYGWRGSLVGVLFIFLAFAKVVRWVRSKAASVVDAESE